MPDTWRVITNSGEKLAMCIKSRDDIRLTVNLRYPITVKVLRFYDDLVNNHVLDLTIHCNKSCEITSGTLVVKSSLERLVADIEYVKILAYMMDRMAAIIGIINQKRAVTQDIKSELDTYRMCLALLPKAYKQYPHPRGQVLAVMTAVYDYFLKYIDEGFPDLDKSAKGKEKTA